MNQPARDNQDDLPVGNGHATSVPDFRVSVSDYYLCCLLICVPQFTNIFYLFKTCYSRDCEKLFCLFRIPTFEPSVKFELVTPTTIR